MDFYKRLGIVCRAVPEGKVITYGQAALLCGYPKNARQVGYGLKKELADRKSTRLNSSHDSASRMPSSA